jgi:hypothetical protein
MEKPAPRVNIQLVVALEFEECGTTAQGVSQNISETGVLIRSSKLAPRGAVARLEFKEFKTEAEVIWTKEAEHGLLLGMRFLSMGWRARKALSDILESTGEEGY